MIKLPEVRPKTKAGLKPGSFKKVVLDMELARRFWNYRPLSGQYAIPAHFLGDRKGRNSSRKEEIFPKLQVMVQQTLYVSTSLKQEFHNREGDAQNIRPSR